MSTSDRVSTNAMYVLFGMIGLFALISGLFSWIVLIHGFANIPGEVIAFFSAAIGVLGTIIGTLIQTLWGQRVNGL